MHKRIHTMIWHDLIKSCNAKMNHGVKYVTIKRVCHSIQYYLLHTVVILHTLFITALTLKEEWLCKLNCWSISNATQRNDFIYFTDVNMHMYNYRRFSNDSSMMETKPSNGRQADQLNFTNNRRTENRPVLLTIDGSKPTNDSWHTLHKSFTQYHHC